VNCPHCKQKMAQRWTVSAKHWSCQTRDCPIFSQPLSAKDIADRLNMKRLPTIEVEDGPVIKRLILYCPSCGLQHVDRGVWAKRPHRKHLCEGCGSLFTPSDEFTAGVETIDESGS
jgi:transposase-like protein